MPAQLNRSQPPRLLDLYSQLVLIFSGFNAIFGWIFFGFGMIFFWIFGMNSTAVNWFSFGGGSWEKTEGSVQAIHDSNFEENERDIYKIRYQFKIGGLDYYGTSYATGDVYQVGDKVPIEYQINNPKSSQIEGLRNRPFSAWLFPLVLLFPAIGIGFIWRSLNTNLKSLELLKHGRFSLGTQISKEETGESITINEVNYPIYKYKFEFEVYSQKYIAPCKTHLTDLVEDDDKEIVLYDPYAPEIAMVYDAVPNVPELDGYGNMSAISPKKAWVLIAPILSIIGHGLVAFIWFFI